MKRSRVGLKRQAADVMDDEGRRRPAAVVNPDDAQQGSEDQTEPVARSWATDFAVEVEAGAGLQVPLQSQQHASSEQMARQQSLVISDSEVDELDDPIGAENLPELASLPADDNEAQQGLLKVIASMRRRVDDGRVQLLCSQRLQHQKQQLIARGQAVLQEHCAATWQQQQQQQEAGVCPTRQQQQVVCVEVHQLQASCAAGQWWLQASISLSEQQYSRIGLASLLALSPNASLVCKQQQCSGLASNSDSSGEEGRRSLLLTAALDLERPQGQQQPPLGEAPWVDVFLLLEQAADPASTAAAADKCCNVLAAPSVAAPPQLLGRVLLDWGEWVKSHSGSHQPAFKPPVCPPKQHRTALVVEARRLDLRCLRSIAQQLGCVPAVPVVPVAAGEDGSSLEFVLQGATAGSDSLSATATLRITQHSSEFAEVLLQASSCQLLTVLQEQLGAALAQAALQAGLPADDVTVQHSLLGPEYARQQAAAAVALVQELDASIEWVETLLKEKLSLESQHRRQTVPGPGPVVVRQVQGAALAAMAATDGHMVSLLRGP